MHICKINHTNWSECGKMAESWPFVYVVDFWHWLQFEWFEFFTRRNIKYALAVANSNRIGIEHVSNRRERERERERKQRNKEPNSPKNRKQRNLLKPQIKISTTLNEEDAHLANINLGILSHSSLIPFCSCKANWFSWSANIYTCMLQYKPINSILIPIRLPFSNAIFSRTPYVRFHWILPPKKPQK